MYNPYIKRVLDFLFALASLIILSPIIIIVYLLLLIENRGKVFFYQKRPGYKERPFYIVKFKTMTDKKDTTGQLLPDVIRLTRLGKIIRQYSLDEIPQLFNVLKGDMSLVGPRPLLFKYLPLYSQLQKRRHDVRPGITGWAQVNGRNSISWTQKFKYDVYYVDNISLLLDIKILWLTLLKVIKREGVNQSLDRPMRPFNGSN